MNLPAQLLLPLVAAGGVLAGAGLTLLSERLAQAERLELRPPRWERIATPGLAGIVLAALTWRLGVGWPLVIRSLWALVLIQVTFFDLRHRLILDRVLLPASLLAAVLSLTTPGLSWQQSLLAGALTGLTFLVLSRAGQVLFRAEALGLGDVKLSVFLGLCLGFPGVLWAIVAGMLAGGVAAATLLATGRAGRRDHFAYGPFLAGGSLLALFLLPTSRA